MDLIRENIEIVVVAGAVLALWALWRLFRPKQKVIGEDMKLNVKCSKCGWQGIVTKYNRACRKCGSNDTPEFH